MWTVVVKDLTIELRTGEALSSLFLLALLILLVFAFALDPDRLANPESIAGMLWGTLILAAMLSFNRSFLLERELGGWTGLALAPIDRGSIYLGKAIANSVFLSIAATFLLPLIILFLNPRNLDPTPALPLAIGLGVLGVAAVGTLFAAIAIRTRVREVLLPILIFPLLAPLVICAARATAGALAGASASELSSWLGVMAVFDLLFWTAGWMTFDFIVDE